MLKLIILCSIVFWASGAPANDENLRCKACHTLVGELKDLIQTGLAQSQVINYVKDICEKLPSEEKDVCYFFLKDHSEQVFGRLASDLTPSEICQKLPSRICPPVVQSVEEPAEEPVEQPEEVRVQENVKDAKCDLCKIAVEIVDKLVGNNRTIAALNSTLEKFCESLPGELKDLCEQFEPDVIQALKTGFPPDVACKDVKLCTEFNAYVHIPCDACYIATKTIGVKDPEAICSKLESCQTEVEAYQQEQAQNAAIEEPQASWECELCKFVFNEVDKKLDNNKTKAAINSTVEKICNSLPGEVGDLCKKYQNDIVNVIDQGIAADVGCRILKLCKDGNVRIPCDVCYTTSKLLGMKDSESICSELENCQRVEANEEEEEVQTAPEEEPEAEWDCDICKFVVDVVEKRVVTNKSIAAINKTLENVCNSLPVQFHDTCLKFEPQVIALIEQELPPATVCELIKLCTENSYPYISAATIPCDVCQATMKAVAGEKGVDICFDIPGVCLMPGQLVEDEPEPKRQPVPECEVCQFMVQSVSDQVQSFGEEKIVEVFEKVCSQMPEQEQQFCTKYGSSVIETVMGGVSDPRQSCVRMTVCEPAEPKEPEHKEPVTMEMQQQSNVKEDGKCEVCQLLILMLEQVVKDNKTMSGVNSTLYKFCDILPAKLDLHNLADAKCELCKFSVGLLVQEFKKGGPEINKTLVGICNKLSTQYQAICLSLVPEIEKFVKDGIDPTQACQAVNMCPKTESASVPLAELCENCMGIIEKAMPGEFDEEAADALCSRVCHPRHRRSVGQIQSALGEIKAVEKDLTDLKKVRGELECEACKIICLTVDNLLKDNKTAKLINDTVYEVCLKLSGEQLIQKEDAKCDICKAAITWLDSKINSTSTKKEINDTVYKFCDGLPDTLKGLCLQFAPQIVSTFEKGVNATEACQKIGLCNSADGMSKKSKEYDTTNRSQKKQIKEWKKEVDPNDIKCTACKAVVIVINALLNKNGSAEKLNETIYKFCDTLPATEKALCYAVAPILLNDTKKGFNATKVCQEIKACPQSDEKSFIPMTMKLVMPSKKSNNDLECSLCKAVVQEADTLIDKNSTVEKINTTVYNLCNKFPGSLKDTCIKLAPRIVEVIAGGADPDFVCEKIGLCKETKQKVVAQVQKQPGDEICDDCQNLVKFLTQFIPANATDQEANKTLEEFCNTVLKPIKSECEKLIPDAVHVFHDRKNPQKACQDIGLCSSATAAKVISYLVHQRLQRKSSGTIGKKTLKCDICMKVMQTVYDDLSDNYPKIRRAIVNNVCNKLPDTLSTHCSELSSSDLSYYWKQFLSNYTPSLICEMAECEEYHPDYPLKESNRT